MDSSICNAYVLYSFFPDVMDAWAGKNAYILLSKVGPYKVFYADIARTAPNMELESEVQ